MSNHRELNDVVAEIRSARQLSRILKIPFYERSFETFIRELVKEVTEQKLANYLNPAIGKPSMGSCFQSQRYLELRLLQEVPHTIWTGQPIEGQGGCSIQVALFDVSTGRRITSGPEASAEVEIVALHGAFDGHDRTIGEFQENIIQDREGKNLLKGDVIVRLREGIVSINSLHVVHRRGWMMVNMLRLGAKCVDINVGMRVKEAKTEPFTVKDKRLIKKSEEPCLTDKVSLLKNIGKAAINYLEAKNIFTVKDFLIQYNLNPGELKETLHWSDRKLTETVNHGRKCKLEREYLYHFSSYDHSVGVVFSEVYDVMGMVHGRSKYTPHSQLTQTEKDEAKNLAKNAFENKTELILWTEPFPFPMELEGPNQKNAEFCANAEYVNAYKPSRPWLEPEELPDMDNRMEIDVMELGGLEICYGDISFRGEYDDFLCSDEQTYAMREDTPPPAINTTVDNGKRKCEGKRGSESLFEEVNKVLEADDFSYRKAVTLKKKKSK